jgi:hypothetical protein
MDGAGPQRTTDAMVDALPCFSLVPPHTEHLRPPPRGCFRCVHHRGRDCPGSHGFLSSDIRDSRGISLRPHGHPVVDIRPSGRGRHPLRRSAHRCDRLVALVASGSRGRRCGDEVGKAVFWDLYDVFVRVWSCERLDDAAALV